MRAPRGPLPRTNARPLAQQQRRAPVLELERVEQPRRVGARVDRVQRAVGEREQRVAVGLDDVGLVDAGLLDVGLRRVLGAARPAPARASGSAAAAARRAGPAAARTWREAYSISASHELNALSRLAARGRPSAGIAAAATASSVSAATAARRRRMRQRYPLARGASRSLVRSVFRTVALAPITFAGDGWAATDRGCDGGARARARRLRRRQARGAAGRPREAARAVARGRDRARRPGPRGRPPRPRGGRRCSRGSGTRRPSARRSAMRAMTDAISRRAYRALPDRARRRARWPSGG